MIPRLVGVPAFVQVAEQRSFRGAARILGVTPTAVSKAVSRLEAHLDTKLLNRTSRHVSLTPEGQVYLSHCRAALDRMRAGEEALVRAARVAKGRVRVSLSPVLGRPIVRALGRLRERYPRISVELTFSDREVSFAEAVLDVAVRIGELSDSSLVARRLRTPRWVTVASPSYLAREGAIETPGDLEGHTCLCFARPDGGVAELRFGGASPRMTAPLVLDDGNFLVDGAIAGLGVAQAFDFLVEGPIARGELVEILAQHAPPSLPVHALTVSGRQRVPRVRAFLEFLEEVLGE